MHSFRNNPRRGRQGFHHREVIENEYQNPTTSYNYTFQHETTFSYAQASSNNLPPNSTAQGSTIREICTYYLKGRCRYGIRCRNAHAEICNICNNYIIHPDKPDREHQEHMSECLPIQPSPDTQDIECCICMDKVINTKSGRFGLLNCEHPFCLTCIRQWRTNTVLDNKVIRSCPICRENTYFITPSFIWVTDKDEKDKIISAYKEEMSQKPCRYFNEGEGECPFGSSCFYTHKYKDGTIETHELRRVTDQYGMDVLLNEIEFTTINLELFMEPLINQISDDDY